MDNFDQNNHKKSPAALNSSQTTGTPAPNSSQITGTPARNSSPITGTPARKKDRRTIYTENVVKDALLELMESHHFDEITVAMLCRQAEITRATFYLHFDSLDQILDAVIKDAIFTAEEQGGLVDPSERAQKMRVYMKNGESFRGHEDVLAPCQRAAMNPKYHNLFMDATLSSYIVGKIYALQKDKEVPYLMKRLHTDADTADNIFRFTLNGFYAINTKMKWHQDDEWYRMQRYMNQFMEGGMEALRWGSPDIQK